MNNQTILLGAFNVGRRIGRGGMASVYEGEHRATGVPVAIKVIRREAGAQTRRRFHEEVQAHAGLVHPGIVYLFEYGKVETAAQKRDDTTHSPSGTASSSPKSRGSAVPTGMNRTAPSWLG